MRELLLRSRNNGFKPPKAVRDAARTGLELRARFGRGGTPVGWARARDLANGRALSLSTMFRMLSYFQRHAVDARAAGWGVSDKPSTGWIAWLLWGGNPGRAWVTRELLRRGWIERAGAGRVRRVRQRH